MQDYCPQTLIMNSRPLLPAFSLKSRLILLHRNYFVELKHFAISVNKMSGQMKLSSFFKLTSKRPSSETLQTSPKKVKTEKENENSNTKKQLNESPKISFPDLQDTMNVSTENTNKITHEIESYCQKYKILDKKMGHSWFNALKKEFDKPYFKKLDSFVTSERSKNTIYPPEDLVWSWTRHCPIENIKVVILGQDPYHNPGQAHGLCFSVPIGVPAPPSLLNMYKELENDIKGFKNPNHGYLVGWARQGVLLLNAVLTVKKNSPNSHKDQGWEELTTAVIKYLNDRNKGVVFLLWGSYAQKKASFVDQKKHCVLKTVHPSPLSAARGWFGCKHFSKCNDYLTQQNKKPIDWCQLPEK